ncbi:MAG: hypothetical protein ACFBSE_12475 [Prochloraceae cyanobacterium]
MPVAAKSVVENTRSRRQKVARKIRNGSKTSRNKIITKDSSFKSPSWLRSLLLIQKSSGAISLATIAMVFTIYAAIVYTQQMWSKEYRKLKNLQRQERLLTETNETLKNNLADLAEKSSTGVVPLNPQKTVFLTPTPIKSTTEIKEKIEIEPIENIASGY